MVSEIISLAILPLNIALPVLGIFVVVFLIILFISKSIFKDALITFVMLIAGYIVTTATVIISAFIVNIFV